MRGDSFHARSSDTVELAVSLLLAAAIPLPIRLFTPIAILCCCIIVANGVWNKRIDLSVLRTPLFIICAVSFGLLVIGLLYSNNLKSGLLDIERNVMILILPFVVYQLKSVTVQKLVFAFMIGTLALSMYAFLHAVITLSSSELIWMFRNGHSFYTDHMGLHPSYLGIFCIFIFFSMIEFLRTKGSSISRKTWAGVIVLLLVIFALIVFVRARISLLILLTMLLAYTILLLPKATHRMAMALTLVAIFVISYYSIDLQQLNLGIGRNASWAISDRFEIWHGAWQGYKLSPVFGGGTGGEQMLIDEGFLKTGYHYALDGRYNAHNQYLQNLCRNGVFDLLLLLALCVYSYRKAFGARNIIFITFLLITTFAMVSETFLGKQKGVAFFYFFLSAFIYLKDE
jgi:O-antigen ligase